jgi:magnesium chelatase family protein
LSLSIVYSRALVGVDAVEVTVEAHLSNGLPGFAIVGLPETAVKEAKERVRSAILNSGLEFPARRITLNLAPADLPKAGGTYDLAIALSVLQASGQLPETALVNTELMGELALTGELRFVRGVLAATIAAKKQDRTIFVPAENHFELQLTAYSKGHSCKSLLDVVSLVSKDPGDLEANGDLGLGKHAGESLNRSLDKSPNRRIDKSADDSVNDIAGKSVNDSPDEASKINNKRCKSSELSSYPTERNRPGLAVLKIAPTNEPDIEDEIKGQAIAKFAVKVAAAGQHNLLLIGPPGCGKTLLANRLIQLLPPLSNDDAMEVASIRSVAGFATTLANCFSRPVRTPHHTATAVSLLGGGVKAMPGEISFAHHGLLFLDELTEFKRGVLESLREPLETGEIYITRANYRVRFPASFQLIGAMNPCPCGYSGDIKRQCRCSTELIDRYLAKLSGPLLDRFDLIVELPGLSQTELLLQPSSGRNPATEQQEIVAVQALQIDRNKVLNSRIKTADLPEICALSESQKLTLAGKLDVLGVSSRATHRIIKVARTIADLQDSEKIEDAHLNKALMLRRSRLVNRLME